MHYSGDLAYLINLNLNKVANVILIDYYFETIF